MSLLEIYMQLTHPLEQVEKMVTGLLQNICVTEFSVLNSHLNIYCFFW